MLHEDDEDALGVWQQLVGWLAWCFFCYAIVEGLHALRNGWMYSKSIPSISADNIVFRQVRLKEVLVTQADFSDLKERVQHLEKSLEQLKRKESPFLITCSPAEPARIESPKSSFNLEASLSTGNATRSVDSHSEAWSTASTACPLALSCTEVDKFPRNDSLASCVAPRRGSAMISAHALKAVKLRNASKAINPRKRSAAPLASENQNSIKMRLRQINSDTTVAPSQRTIDPIKSITSDQILSVQLQSVQDGSAKRARKKRKAHSITRTPVAMISQESFLHALKEKFKNVQTPEARHALNNSPEWTN